MDGNGIAVIIAAVFLGLQQLWAMWLAYKREKDKLKRDAEVAAKVAKVAEDQEAVATEVQGVKTTLLETNTAKMDAIVNVQAALADNTATTVEVRDLVNGQKAALLAEVAVLKADLAAEIARHLPKIAPKRETP